MHPMLNDLRKVGQLGIRSNHQNLFCCWRQCFAALALFVSLSAAADDFQVYGPEDFMADQDGQTIIKLFQFAEDTDELFKLRIHNGGKERQYGRIARLKLSVNGNDAVLIKEMDRGLGYSESLLPLLDGNNSIKVQVYGNAGEGVSIEVVANDEEPPEIYTSIIPEPNEQGWNNSDTNVSFTCTDNYGVVQCPAPLFVNMDGEAYAIDGTAKDVAGNVTEADIKISLDKTPPIVKAVTSPAPNSLGWHTSDTRISFICSDNLSGIASCPSSVFLDIEGEQQEFSATTIDKAGNSSETSIVINLDKTPPLLRIVTPDSKYYQSIDALEINLSYSDLNGVNHDSLRVKLDDKPLSVNCVKQEQSATCSIVDPMSPGEHQLEVSVSDFSGITAKAFTTFIYQDVADHDEDGVANDMDRCSGTPLGANVDKSGCYNPVVPVDPALNAPGFESQESFLKQVEFLYTESNPVQSNVKVGAVNNERAAVVRGRVVNASGDPLPGVKVSVINHPEFGNTYSREDGVFDMAVNGGVSLSFEYAMPGYFLSRSEMQIRRNKYNWLPEVVMASKSKQPVSVDLSDNKLDQWVRGEVVNDADGSRQASLFIPASVSALVEFANGAQQVLNHISLRATEFKVSEDEEISIPGRVPQSISQSYAIDLSADEVRKGVLHLDMPVPLYVDNFLKLPVGHTVPVARYDKKLAKWKPGGEGRVIEVLVIRDGVALLDITGDGVDASQSELEQLGITDEELAALASAYQPGDTLWRTTIDQLTSWAFNWPQEAGYRATAPNIGAPNVSHVDQSYRIDIPLSDYAVPPELQAIELTVVVAGQRVKRTFPPHTRQNYIYTWDGNDAYGRQVNDRVEAHITIAYRYQSVYMSDPNQTAGQRSIEIARSNVSTIALSRDWKVALYPDNAQRAVENSQAQSRKIHVGKNTTFSNNGRTTRIISTAKHNTEPNQALDVPEPIGPITATAEDGTLYIATIGRNNFIRSVSPVGPVTTVVPPSSQRLSINQLLIGVDGRLYYAALYLNEGSVIKRLNHDGSETLVAGGGSLYSDGIPATRYRFDGLVEFEIERNGALTVFEEGVRTGERKTYRVDRMGLIQSLIR